MDTFFEQIVRVRRTPLQILSVIAIVIAALVVITVALGFVIYIFAPLAALLVLGAGWGAYKLIGLSSIEYEYIFTNGDLDVDKIIAKSSRKRMVSINCSKVERYGDYNPANRAPNSVKKVYTFCDAYAENAKFLIAPSKKDGLVMIVFTPDDRVGGAIEKAIPRIAL